MSEPQPPGSPDSTAYHPTGAERPEPTVAAGEAIFPTGAEPSDDTPTIISKSPPARNGASPGEGLVGGSLRGRSLAHFELIEPIGVGGMAAVIRARDRQLDRSVALKILPPEMASDPENVRRFHQEARAAAKLDHENIARVFFCGEDQRLHFIAFEFVEGVNLRTLLERRGRVPVHEAVHYMLQIATGLAHAAARGVVHRDIKPSNIIISPNGRAKLVDMGLARNMGPQSDRDLTQSGVTLGTFDYIAPEQAMDPREADVRSDIYSLGCTFYHMLTGQPPVPEGTAAKKLHYHQHVAPVDPRQLNPAIPDDVAAILQRMMAKDPKERYQRAEHLVQHLIQVAQKLGAITDLPDGVLFVDAPLPTPPRKRPLLMAAVGALILGVLLIVLSFAPGPSTKPRLPGGVRPQTDAQPAAARDQSAGEDKKKIEGSPDGTKPRLIRTEADLRAALAGKAPSVFLKLDGSLAVREGVAFEGKGGRELSIQSEDPDKPARIRVRPPAGPGAPWGGLEIRGGRATFRDLVFEIDLGPAPDTPETLIAAILVKGAAHVTFERCTFTQTGPPPEGLIARPSLVPVASVGVVNPIKTVAEKTTLVLKQCYFQRGQAAVSVLGNADVSPTNCAFGPHATLFHLRGEEDRDLGINLNLKYVSAILAYGPAFRLDKGAACEISAQRSIFSCPEKPSLDKYDAPDLIRQTGTLKRTVKFTGDRNCYHNLNALWSRDSKGAHEYEDWALFRASVQKNEGDDQGSNYLTDAEKPWKAANPTRASEESPLGFKVNPLLPELRLTPGSRQPIGVQKCLHEDVAGKLPDLAKASPPNPGVPRKPNEKIVDPNAEERTQGVYRTVAGAIIEAKDGDVILIKQSGPVEISPVAVKVGLRLTIRPEGDHRPVLTLAGKTVGSDVALFTLHHGQLRFENLEFLLKPDRKAFNAQAVLAMAGGQGVFKDCLFTLELPDGSTAALSVVTLPDCRDAMKMAMAEVMGEPDVRLERCFVRGEGDLATIRPSRAFSLTLDSTLAALTGSLVNVDGNGAEALVGTAKVTLRRATTYLHEHLVCLRGKSSKGLAFTQVTADDCLFASAGGKALVHLEGPDNDEQMKRVFGWIGRRNTYAGFDKVLEQQSAGEGMAPLRYGQEEWKRFANETDPEPRFVQLKLAVPPLAERPLSQAVPEQFRDGSEPPVDLRDCGAVLKQLPRPFGERARVAPDETPPQPGDESEA
jgi:serine/threonine protein kinase